MHSLLPDSLAIDTAAADPAQRVAWDKIPAKMAVYLLTAPEEGQDKPVLLATVGNLRAALQRRLTDLPPDQKTKRVAYGQICTQLHYRIVHSPLLAHYTYWAVAREIFPESYRDMLGWRPAWWITLNPKENFPRFRRTQEIALNETRHFGPIPERTATGRLIETLEDLFELCRHYEILRQAPAGKACAYKEMGKCPAPCDGTVPMEHYHRQLHDAADYLSRGGYAAWRDKTESAMKAAAARLDFEAAGKIKTLIQRGSYVTADPFVHMRELREFKYLSLQPGKGKPWIQPLIIRGSEIHELAPMARKTLPAAAAGLLEECRKAQSAPISQTDAEVIGLICRHLARGNEDAGVYLPLAEVQSTDDILQAAQTLAAKKNVRPLADRASDEKNSDAPTDPLTPAANPADASGDP